MRELTTGTNEHTTVAAADKPTFGGANHEYKILSVPEGKALETIFFQQGPVKEHGINGIHNEDLICIVIDRLEGFQSGKYACGENQLAIRKLEAALRWLNQRTNRRKESNIEGTSLPDVPPTEFVRYELSEDKAGLKGYYDGVGPNDYVPIRSNEFTEQERVLHKKLLEVEKNAEQINPPEQSGPANQP